MPNNLTWRESSHVFIGAANTIDGILLWVIRFDRFHVFLPSALVISWQFAGTSARLPNTVRGVSVQEAQLERANPSKDADFL